MTYILNEARILTPQETAGLAIRQIVTKCAARGMAQGRPLKVAVMPHMWDVLLSSCVHENWPVTVQPAQDGRTARIVLFVSGNRLEVLADAGITDRQDQRWVHE